MEQYRDFAFVYDELMNEVDYNGWVKYIEDIIKNVDIVGYNLKTEKFGIKGNYIPGFMGKVNIKVKGSAEFKNNISKLLQFGEYSGVGLKCTMGMGVMEILQVQKINYLEGFLKNMQNINKNTNKFRLMHIKIFQGTHY